MIDLLLKCFPSIYTALLTLSIDESSALAVGGTLVLKCQYAYDSNLNTGRTYIRMGNSQINPDFLTHQFGNNCCTLDDTQRVFTVRKRDLQLNLNGTAFKCGAWNPDEGKIVWSNTIVVLLSSSMAFLLCITILII